MENILSSKNDLRRSCFLGAPFVLIGVGHLTSNLIILVRWETIIGTYYFLLVVSSLIYGTDHH